jgi:hypothetical protein
MYYYYYYYYYYQYYCIVLLVLFSLHLLGFFIRQFYGFNLKYFYRRHACRYWLNRCFSLNVSVGHASTVCFITCFYLPSWNSSLGTTLKANNKEIFTKFSCCCFKTTGKFIPVNTVRHRRRRDKDPVILNLLGYTEL